MTQLFKTIKIPEEINESQSSQRHNNPHLNRTQCPYCGELQDNCCCDGEEECEHEDMEFMEVRERNLEDGYVEEIREYACTNCDYWVLERWTAQIGEYDYDEIIDSGY